MAFSGLILVVQMRSDRPGLFLAKIECLSPSELQFPLSKRETVVPHRVIKHKACVTGGVTNLSGPDLPDPDRIPRMRLSLLKLGRSPGKQLITQM